MRSLTPIYSPQMVWSSRKRWKIRGWKRSRQSSCLVGEFFWIQPRCTNIHPSSVTQKSGVKSNIKPPPPPETTILDVYNFDEVVMVRHVFRDGSTGRVTYICLQDQTKNVLVSFTVSAVWSSFVVSGVSCNTYEQSRLLGVATARISNLLTRKVSMRNSFQLLCGWAYPHLVAKTFKPESNVSSRASPCLPEPNSTW